MALTDRQRAALEKLQKLSDGIGPLPTGVLAVGPMPIGELIKIQDRLWPKDYKSESPVALTATRKLTSDEWAHIKYAIGAHELMTNMFCANMFGGYGMNIYDEPRFVGFTPDIILTLVEDNLPELTRFEQLEGKTREKRTPGAGSDYAWEEFSQFTHCEQNLKWLKFFNLEPPKSRGHYDY